MNREVHAGICGSPGVRFPGATRPAAFSGPVVIIREQRGAKRGAKAAGDLVPRRAVRRLACHRDAK